MIDAQEQAILDTIDDIMGRVQKAGSDLSVFRNQLGHHFETSGRAKVAEQLRSLLAEFEPAEFEPAPEEPVTQMELGLEDHAMIDEVVAEVLEPQPQPEPQPEPDPERSPTATEQVQQLVRETGATEFRAEHDQEAVGYPPGTYIYNEQRQKRGRVHENGIFECYVASGKMTAGGTMLPGHPDHAG